MKPTKAGDGSLLELEMDIIERPYQGRKIWDRLNLNNPYETAVKIARGTLSSICRAVNVLQPKDSYELHDLPLLVKVVCKKRADTDELTNEVKGYKRRDAHSRTNDNRRSVPERSKPRLLRSRSRFDARSESGERKSQIVSPAVRSEFCLSQCSHFVKQCHIDSASERA